MEVELNPLLAGGLQQEEDSSPAVPTCLGGVAVSIIVVTLGGEFRDTKDDSAVLILQDYK